MTDEKPSFEFNWIQAAAGSLAAVTSAVLLSTVGVAGTLIGAALGSLALTTGNAVYSYYIRVTKQRVGTAQMVAAARIGLAQTKVRDASADAAAGTPVAAEELADELAEVDEDLGRAQAVLEDADPDEASPGWRGVLAALPWKRIVLVSTGIFVSAMALILAFELATGKAVSSYTGGSDTDRRTSIPGLGGGGTTEEQDDVTEEERQEAPTEPSDEEELLVPDDEATAPTPTPEETAPVEPTPTPTPTPATEPTEPAPTVESTPEASP